MKLISCNNCAVVLDQDKMQFASDLYTDDGGIDLAKADYDQERKDYFVFLPCPVCGTQIFKE